MDILKSKTIYLFFYFLFSLFNPVLSQWIMEDTLHYNEGLFRLISVADSSIVWAAGSDWNTNDKLIYKRNSSGIWNIVPLNGIPVNNQQITAIAAINSETAVIGLSSGNASLYITTNSGQNWQLLITTGGTQGFINDIRFSRKNPGYGYAWSDPPMGNGTPFKIYKTSNYGETWTTYDVLTDPNYKGASPSICVTDSSHAWFGLQKNIGGSNYGKILYTSNGGINFSVLSMSLVGTFMKAIEFQYNNLYGFSIMESQVNYYSKTTNGGINWSSVNSSYYIGNSHRIISIPNSSVWYAANDDLNSNKILKSTNDGSSWFPMQIPAGQYIIKFMDAISVNNKVYAYAVSLPGYILKLVDSVTLIGINNNNTNVPTNYVLLQNYPNPFNPQTTIDFNVPSRSFINITVFDILGREVSVLVNELKNPGNYSVQFNAEQLSSGIYLYKMTSDNFIDVKKMIIQK